MPLATGKKKGLGVKRKSKGKLKKHTSALSVEQLIASANSCLDQFPPDVDSAKSFLEQALTVDADRVEVLDALGGLLCEEGDHPRATQLLQRSASLQPEEGHDKYFYLAQMSSGTDALAHYQRGLEVLKRRMSAAVDGTNTVRTPEQHKVAVAHSSIAELYMTELCDEEDAEDKCENALRCGFDVDPNCLELLVTKITLRKVQGNIAEAKEISLACCKLINETFDSCNPDAVLPSDETCIAFCRSLIDLGLLAEARSLLVKLLEQDEEDIQVWYLLACSHLVDQDGAAVKECAERGLALCERGPNAEDWIQPLSDVLAQAAQLVSESRDDAEEDHAEGGR